jgi:hypothetical protein
MIRSRRGNPRGILKDAAGDGVKGGEKAQSGLGRMRLIETAAFRDMRGDWRRLAE